jgi:NitT/TauT family transport system ATP-binding protein
VIGDLVIELGDDRDQITTRALPRFAEPRTRVLSRIRGAAPPPPAGWTACGVQARPPN